MHTDSAYLGQGPWLTCQLDSAAVTQEVLVREQLMKRRKRTHLINFYLREIENCLDDCFVAYKAEGNCEMVLEMRLQPTTAYSVHCILQYARLLADMVLSLHRKQQGVLCA